jgi:hypothetical protein
MGPTMLDGDPIRSVLSDRDRSREVDAILQECRGRVRTLLQQKRHVVEGVRDALLEREELIGDEIEALMAELGEREPIEVPALTTGNGHGHPLGLGDGNRRGPGGNGDAPPRPDTPRPGSP